MGAEGSGSLLACDPRDQMKGCDRLEVHVLGIRETYLLWKIRIGLA